MPSSGKENITGNLETLLAHPERRGAVSGPRREPSRFLYKAYGLTVESEIELPELSVAKGLAPQVIIRFGKTPEVLANQIANWEGCMASANEFVFSIDRVAKYHIAFGNAITIERRAGGAKSVPGPDIRLWLLSRAFPALLHQRGLLPLHVSALETPRGAWAFTGKSGEGKSTLAGFLHRRLNLEVVSDDVAVIDPKGPDPVICPGPKKLKLWADALDHFKFHEYEVVRDHSAMDKFQVCLATDTKYNSPMLHALVTLDSVPQEASPTIERLYGIEAFNVCVSAIYRPFIRSCFEQPAETVHAIASLCRKVHVYRYCRPRSLDDFAQNAAPLIDLMRKVG